MFLWVGSKRKSFCEIFFCVCEPILVLSVPGFGDVHGHRGNGRHEPADHRRRKVTADVVVEEPRAEQKLLGLRVAGQLGSVHHHGPSHRGQGSSPQREQTFLLRYPEQCVHHVLVVSPLVDGQPPVGSHPDEGHFSRCPCVEDGWISGEISCVFCVVWAFCFYVLINVLFYYFLIAFTQLSKYRSVNNVSRNRVKTQLHFIWNKQVLFDWKFTFINKLMWPNHHNFSGRNSFLFIIQSLGVYLKYIVKPLYLP